jgi:uncharacterized Zn-finger protein
MVSGRREPDDFDVRLSGSGEVPVGAERGPKRNTGMSESVVPHFHNTSGVPMIEIGAREFMCVGEKPPFDHPHVFLDMGDATEMICPYCSTLFRYDPSLAPMAARPPECALHDLE